MPGILAATFTSVAWITRRARATVAARAIFEAHDLLLHMGVRSTAGLVGIRRDHMSKQQQAVERRELPRLSTGIAGLDIVTGGGLPVRRTCLIAGLPGTGKTTLANQLAFSHAARGGRVIIATLLTESHDVLLENLQSFSFVDPGLVADGV